MADNNLVKFTGNQVSTVFADTIYIPPTMALGQDGAPVTQAEVAFGYQVAAVYVQSQINGFTAALLNKRHEEGRRFVHDHSAFRMFYTKGEEDVRAVEAVLQGEGTDVEKIGKLKPILAKEEAIARKMMVLDSLGYKPVQVLDLREKLNIVSFLYVHKGDPERNVLPQNVPATFVSFIMAEREQGQTPGIIRKYVAQEKDPLTKEDYQLLERLGKGETLTADEANSLLKNLARSQTRLWPNLTSAEYDAVVASEEGRKTLNVAAEVLVVGYLLNHATERPQDLSRNPASAEEALAIHDAMEKIVGSQNMNPMSFKKGDDDPSKVGKRNMQGNTKSYMANHTFADGKVRKVSYGFVEWAGWQPERTPDGKPVIHEATGQVVLAPVFDAGRTGAVFAKQKTGTALTAGDDTKALPGTKANGATGNGPKREMGGPEC